MMQLRKVHFRGSPLKKMLGNSEAGGTLVGVSMLCGGSGKITARSGTIVPNIQTCSFGIICPKCKIPDCVSPKNSPLKCRGGGKTKKCSSRDYISLRPGWSDLPAALSPLGQLGVAGRRRSLIRPRTQSFQDWSSLRFL